MLQLHLCEVGNRMKTKKKKAKKLTEAQKMNMEEKFKPVESDIFNNVLYAVERRGKGIVVYYKNVPLPLDAEDIKPFAKELVEIWEVHGEGVTA